MSPKSPIMAQLAGDAHLPSGRVVVLAGNPNVGKSVFFNAFTGQYANVSNFPGTTVDVPKGALKGYPDVLLKDTPGVYGLSSLSEEEAVAEKSILAADVVVNVVSALTIERDLFLTQQIIDYGKPLIVAVNQLDEARARGMTVDTARLSKLLGVPVFETVATENQGLDTVREAIDRAAMGHTTPDCPPPATVAELEANMGTRMRMYGLRRVHVNAIVGQVVKHPVNAAGLTAGKRVSQAVGQALLNPVIGLMTSLLVLLALYQLIGVWVAGDLVDWVENGIMLRYVVPVIQQGLGQWVPVDSWLYTLLAGEFGVVTMSIQYIFGVLFPLVLGFYIYMSILEDCGYLPRIAVLADGVLSKIGLNGRAVIPLILGLGCVTMATVSTRVLSSQRERTIASTILAITIPCSAQIGVIVGLMALAGGLSAWLLYCVILFTILLLLGTVLNKLLPGRSTSLVLDLPPMRVPSLKNVATKTWVRTKVFLLEAAPLFMLGSLLVSTVQILGWLQAIQNAVSPVTQWLLHLPAESANAFIMGMVRRDFGAAGLYFLAEKMTPVQIMTALIVITLFVPCIASATVIWKERGIKEGFTVLVGSWVLAFAVGGVLTRLLEWVF
jgi:ferrous iron transport protein B